MLRNINTLAPKSVTMRLFLVVFSLFLGQCQPLLLLAQTAPPPTQKDPQPAASVEPIDEVAFESELQKLASRCEELQLIAEAKLTREWIPAKRTDQRLLFVPSIDEPLASSSIKDNTRTKWEQRFLKLREQHAEHWYRLAKNHAENGDDAAAYLATMRALRESPDHRQSKLAVASIIGGLKSTPKGKISTTPHQLVAWPARSFHRYQTAHFLLSTNVDAKQAAAWAKKLETIYVLWTQIFPELWLPPNAMSSRLSGKPTPLERKFELDIVLFRDQQEYLKHISQVEANASISAGYYHPTSKTSYFFWTEAPELDATLVHELTHQFLQEVSLLRGAPTREYRSDFWSLEAIALYCESLWIGSNFATVGGWESPRLQTARYRALREDFWIPWKELADSGSEAWRENPQIAKWYTQSAGLAHFWLDSPDPKYRTAWLAYLSSVYQLKPNRDLLEDLVSPDKMRDAYVDFLQVEASNLHQLQATRQLRDCVLVGCQIDKDGLAFLKSQNQLQWLDLAFLPVTDEHLSELNCQTQIVRLNLEGTQVTNQATQWIEKCELLEELDLSQTKIDDAVLVPLKRLNRLETLWLTETAVGDNGLPSLETMRSLKFVNVDKSKVTSDGWKAFLVKRPDLGKK